MFSEGKININSVKAPETTEQSRLKRIEITIAWMTVSMNLNYHGTENMQPIISAVRWKERKCMKYSTE